MSLLRKVLIVLCFVAWLNVCATARSQDINLSVINSFDLGSHHWQVYDYNGGVAGGGNVFYPVTWESSGGVGDTGYVWGDDSRWRIDTPENPNSILAFIVYRAWDGDGPIDLRDATLSVYLRGDNLDLKGGSVYFWALNGVEGTRYHLLSSPLTITEGSWGVQQSVVLANDEYLWHRSWSRDPANPASLDFVLSQCDSYGFSFIGFSEEVTGRFSMDEFQIKYNPVPEPSAAALGIFMFICFAIAHLANKQNAVVQSRQCSPIT
jgi:hypothetical protein